MSRSCQHRKKFKININENSNMQLNENDVDINSHSQIDEKNLNKEMYNRNFENLKSREMKKIANF